MSGRISNETNPMNPVPCRFCGQGVSIRAKYCPHCELPLTKPRRFWTAARRVLEVIAFVATAGALWFTYRQLTIQETTSKEQHQSDIIRDSLTREQVRLISEQIAQMKVEVDISNKATVIERQKAEFERARAINEAKPLLYVSEVRLSSDSANTQVSANFINRGKSNATQILVNFRCLALPTCGDWASKHTVQQLEPNRPYGDGVMLLGSVGFKRLMIEVDAEWGVPGLSDKESYHGNFLFVVANDSTSGPALAMSNEQAKRFLDEFAVHKSSTR
jgi:hypothetical protein